MMYTVPDDYNLIYQHFPGDIYAVVRVTIDGYPTIYMNDSLSPQAQTRALAHELRHFEARHFYSHVSIYDAEADAIRSEAQSIMCRKWRDLTEAEQVQLMALGAQLHADFLRQTCEPMPDRLHNLRKEKGLTVAEFASAIGTTPDAVMRWETENVAPEAPAVQRACALLACDLT